MGFKLRVFDSKEEHEFFNKITKYQWFLLAKVLCSIIKSGIITYNWMDTIKQELKILKDRGAC